MIIVNLSAVEISGDCTLPTDQMSLVPVWFQLKKGDKTADLRFSVEHFKPFPGLVSTFLWALHGNATLTRTAHGSALCRVDGKLLSSELI